MYSKEEIDTMSDSYGFKVIPIEDVRLTDRKQYNYYFYDLNNNEGYVVVEVDKSSNLTCFYISLFDENIIIEDNSFLVCVYMFIKYIYFTRRIKIVFDTTKFLSKELVSWMKMFGFYKNQDINKFQISFKENIFKF
jgi:hypothetical protein